MYSGLELYSIHEHKKKNVFIVLIFIKNQSFYRYIVYWHIKII